ncbi:MAG: putative quinol monooxygenase [Pseudomonadota bacterium]
MIVVIAKLSIKPGSVQDVLALAKPCIAETRDEPGCLFYDIHQSLTDPETLVFVEHWETREALSAHFETPHVSTWREARTPFVTGASIEIIHTDNVETL